MTVECPVEVAPSIPRRAPRPSADWSGAVPLPNHLHAHQSGPLRYLVRAKEVRRLVGHLKWRGDRKENKSQDAAEEKVSPLRPRWDLQTVIHHPLPSTTPRGNPFVTPDAQPTAMCRYRCPHTPSVRTSTLRTTRPTYTTATSQSSRACRPSVPRQRHSVMMPTALRRVISGN